MHQANSPQPNSTTIASRIGPVFAFTWDENSARGTKSDNFPRPDQAYRFTWVHADRTAEVAQDWIKSHPAIPDAARHALLETDTRPRVDSFNDGLLVILRAVELTEGADPDELISLRMWLDAERLITLRSKRVMAPSQLRDRLDEGLVAQSPAALMVTLTTLITDNLAELIEDLGEAIGELEEASLGDDLLEKRELVAQHQRRIIAFRRHITPQVHALGRLRAEAPLLHEHSTALRELENRSQRILEELTHLAERGHLLKTEVSEAHTRKADDRMRLLTVLGALFLPLSFLTGLLGINVGGIPGADEGLAFWIVCGAMFGLFVLQLLWLRWRGWI